MARPAKPVKTTKGANTKREIQTRIAVENKIAGVSISPTPPVDFNESRAIIYKWLYEALKPSGLVSVLDNATFKQACIIIDRLNKVDAMIDEVGIADRDLRIARSGYFNQYLKICSELCLSPAARAKMGMDVANKAKDEDPLLSALGGGDE